MKLQQEEYKIIAANPLFFGMKEEKLSEALQELKGKIRTYEKGEFFQMEGQPFKYFGLVLSGIMQVCMDELDGTKMIMANVSAGRSFGESLAFLKEKKSPVYIYAAKKSKVLLLNADCLHPDNQEPLATELQNRFSLILAKRPLEMNQRIQVLSKIKLRDKIETYLSLLQTNHDDNVIEVPLNREDMASYIGADRAALSRELTKMKKEGILDYKKNRFTILGKKKPSGTKK